MLEINFEDQAERPMFDLKVFDTTSGRTFTCEALGCSLEWKDNLLRITFNSRVRISRGILYLTKTVTAIASNILENRRMLLKIPDQIMITDVYIQADGWFFSWTTVAQLVLWFFRTFGSLVLFSYYPVTAMIVDQLVANCAVLSLYLGPSVTTADVVVQIIGRVQIVWYWFGNPFFGWDQTTLACVARPGHADEGVLCSFLDNYGSHTIGWAALSALVAVLYWTATWVLAAKPASAAVQRVCRSVQRDYGLKYVWARLDANQLEVMMYVLISYSLADSSSKSVVGLVLATALMVFYVVVAVGKTFLLHSNLKASPNQETTNLPQSGIILTQANETVARHAEPRRESVGSTSRQATSKIAQYTIYLAFTMKGIRPISGLSQVFGPIVKLVRTFAICILLLNHTSSAVAQLIIGLLLESMYFGTLFFTRSEEKWFDFYSSVAVQLSVMLFLLLKAISTNSSIPSANNQGGMAVILSLTVLFMLATVCACMICAFVSLWFGSADNEEKKQKIEQQTPREQKTMGASNKLQLVQEPEQVRSPDLAVRNPVSQQSVLFYELEIPEEFLDREVPEQVIQIQNRRVDTVTEQIQGSVAQPPRTGMPGISPALFEKESLLQKKTPRDGSKPSGV